MSTSDRVPDQPSRDDRPGPGGLTRHDAVLAVVPAAFLLALLAVGLADVPLRVALGSAAAVGALALVDGLFLNPPRGPRAG